MNYIKIVNELNEEIFQKLGEELEANFVYSTDGFFEAINYAEIMIWNSEEDEREWDEEKNEYEPFKPFIKRIFNEKVEKLEKVKFVETEVPFYDEKKYLKTAEASPATWATTKT